MKDGVFQTSACEGVCQVCQVCLGFLCVCVCFLCVCMSGVFGFPVSVCRSVCVCLCQVYVMDFHEGRRV